MFRNISGFNINDIPQPHIETRYQYFHHYWSILKQKNRDIFFDEVWYESHRSLINKIEQLFENKNKNETYKGFKLFFIENELFSSKNIIAKNKSILRYINIIRNYINPGNNCSENKKENNYKNCFDHIKNHVKKIKIALIIKNEYYVELTNHLIKIVSKNTKINEASKSDIRFLVNALVVELYSFGYNLEYIERIPDILIFKDKKYQFPFELKLQDFNSDKSLFSEYKIEIQKNATIQKCLGGLISLVNEPIKRGYYIFKVENLDLIQPSQISLGDMIFYNPSINSMINLRNVKEDLISLYRDIEFFYSPLNDEPIDLKKKSSCNVIIESNIKSHEDIESLTELYQLFHKVTNGLQTLIEIFKDSGNIIVGYPFIQFHRKIKLHNTKEIASYSFDIFDERKIQIDIHRKEIIDELSLLLSNHNKIDIRNEIGIKINYIKGVQSKLKNNAQLFNFKDIWIGWESIMSKQNMKELAKDIFYIRYKKHFSFMIANFISLNIEKPMYSSFNGFWTLNNTNLKKVAGWWW